MASLNTNEHRAKMISELMSDKENLLAGVRKHTLFIEQTAYDFAGRVNFNETVFLVVLKTQLLSKKKVEELGKTVLFHSYFIS